jgi:hypothetical protein
LRIKGGVIRRLCAGHCNPKNAGKSQHIGYFHKKRFCHRYIALVLKEVFKDRKNTVVILLAKIVEKAKVYLSNLQSDRRYQLT